MEVSTKHVPFVTHVSNRCVHDADVLARVIVGRQVKAALWTPSLAQYIADALGPRMDHTAGRRSVPDRAPELTLSEKEIYPQVVLETHRAFSRGRAGVLDCDAARGPLVSVHGVRVQRIRLCRSPNPVDNPIDPVVEDGRERTPKRR